MIPKTIHYCWFGHNTKPKLAEKCIKSWKKNCQGYDIIEWNEDNFSIDSAPLYVRQAYSAQKWAFVTDYIRLWVLTEYGGIYMDTDVEVLKPLDPFLAHKAFSGFEDDIHIPTGIMACEKGFPLFREFLSFYDNAEFIFPDGSINYQTNVTTITQKCIEKGLKQNNAFQVIEDFTLYPKDVFCPINYRTGVLERSKRTVTIHWFAASWHSKEQQQNELERKKQRRIEQRKQKRGQFYDYVIHFPNRILRLLLGEKKYQAIKTRFKR